MSAELGDLADFEAATAAFTSARPRLFGIAYRMLGSVTEAEDLVQEVWLRWQTYDRSTVDEPGSVPGDDDHAGWPSTPPSRPGSGGRPTSGRGCPNRSTPAADPYLGAERGEALEFATLLLLEKLTPNERAAYVLREAFDYSYGQIADILSSTEPAARQLVSRARKHLAGERRTPVTAASSASC